MTRLKTLILMLCLIMSAAFCKANGVISITNDGAPITLIKASDYGGSDRSGSMLAYINGHTLTVAFTENLGTVLIEIQDETGSPLDLTLLGTPTGNPIPYRKIFLNIIGISEKCFNFAYYKTI